MLYCIKVCRVGPYLYVPYVSWATFVLFKYAVWDHFILFLLLSEIIYFIGPWEDFVLIECAMWVHIYVVLYCAVLIDIDNFVRLETKEILEKFMYI